MDSRSEVLLPYLEGGGPNGSGEQGMYCPLHDDQKRSASINWDKGVFYCNACDRGLTIKELIREINESNEEREEEEGAPRQKEKQPLPSAATIAGWCAALQGSPMLEELNRRRSINEQTVEDYLLGWDSSQSAFTIPIYDEYGELTNVRRYQLDPKDDRRKIWSVAGHGAPSLYPFTSLEKARSILLCEGEFDCLLTLQHGFKAITRTGAADVWKQEWNQYFEGLEVYLCHDMDSKGQKANNKIARELSKVASSVHIVELPYEVSDKHGKDLTDYWQDKHSEDDFEDLVSGSMVWFEQSPEETPLEVADVRIIDTMAASNARRPLRARATITGRKAETHLVPAYVGFSCDMGAGAKCSVCPMNEDGWNGEQEFAIQRDNVLVLEMMDTSTPLMYDAIRRHLRIQKCGRHSIDVMEEQSVEEFYVRPDIDQVRMSYESGDYQTRKVVSVGRHDTLANTTVQIEGKVYPHPKNQVNTFLASEVEKTKDSIDDFELTPEQVERLRIFHGNGSPMRKCVEIARDMAANVTGIYGRTEMHVVMDLMLHSVLGFEYEGAIEPKGWLDVLILGDTRTGKSRAASKLSEHYGVGEIVSCEAATFAGIVGGLSQFSGKEWVVQWGAIPLNDRRAVWLDEAGGLSHEQIGSMSSLRSSGVAELTKIRSERTMSRTRLCWMGNPRGIPMDNYTFGVQGILPLIGQPEDVARFDLAMALSSHDVSSEEINKDREHEGTRYSAEDCHNLVLWAWSRNPVTEVDWAVGAQDLTRHFAIELGRTYLPDPPLVQAASVRIKLARIAAAIAARTFSTLDGRVLYVGREHVEAAFQLVNKLYGMESFGYLELSQEMMEGSIVGDQQRDEMINMLQTEPELSRFLRMRVGGFRTEDLVDVLPNIGLAEANGYTQRMSKLRMVVKNGKEMKITPALRKILREERKNAGSSTIVGK